MSTNINRRENVLVSDILFNSNENIKNEKNIELISDKRNTKIKKDEHYFKEIMNKHKISMFFAKKLKNLKSFKIVYILDDSGSMNKTLEDSPLNKGSFKATRWDELQEFIKISIENILNSFKRSPGGFTPITKRLITVLKDNMPNVLNDKKLLVVIVTDGEPTDLYGLFFIYNHIIFLFNNCNII